MMVAIAITNRFFFLEIAIFCKFCLEASCRVHTGGVRTVNVANPTNGYAAEKGISKVVSADK